MMRRKILKGALHIHSSISYDGTMSVAELSLFFKERKFDFVLITEHSQNVSDGVMNKLIDECNRCSSSGFLIIPGLEFSCRDELHILGIGVSRTSESDDPLEVIHHILQQGGVAVLAHPTKKEYSLDGAWIEELDGVEIWNSAYDGKFLPQAESIRMFKRLAQKNPHLKPFAGMDLHQEKNYYDVTVRIKRKSLNRGQILKDLKEGNFTLESTFFKIKPGIRINRISLLIIFAFRKVLNLARRLRELSHVQQENQDLTCN
jgi:predicted metal-dependent phosphoesterase TrpH